MPTTFTGLEEIVREYHHLQEEHRRTHPEGTARRHLQARLEELEQRFEHRLLEDLGDETERVAWRERLHHGAGAPLVPLSPPLVFKGRSAAGSVVEIRQRPDGDYDVEIDGAPVEKLSGPIDFDVYVDGDRRFPEVFAVSTGARRALAAWAAGSAGEPPWEHLHDLLRDGIVDRHFALTERGRRALRAWAGP